MIISKLQSKLAFFGLLLVSAGCGGKTDLEPVSGQVVYKSKPVEGAQVIFQSDKVARPGMGSTDADGKFQLSTFEFRDGAAVGSYVVTVVKQDTSAAASNPFQTMDEKMKQDPSLTTKMSQELGKKMGGPPVAAKDALPAKYGDPKKSPLKAEVKKSATNQFVFELTD